jgi:hypothetical protein
MFTNSFPQSSLYDQVAKGEVLETPLAITRRTYNPRWNGSLIAQELSAKYDLHSAWADRWAVMEWALSLFESSNFSSVDSIRQFHSRLDTVPCTLDHLDRF